MTTIKKNLGNRIWFKILLTLTLFIPAYAEGTYDPQESANIITTVLKNPLSISIPWLLPIFKLLLLIALLLPTISRKYSRKLLLGYYSFILLIVGLFQNMSFTEEFGFVWLIGNTVIQFIVLAFCLYDVIKDKAIIEKDNLNKNRLCILPLMALAFLMPFGVQNDIIIPSFDLSVLYNEVALTYCMITPVVLGVLILYSKGVYKPTLSIISYVGLLYGLLNMPTWFVIDADSWWMGVLHLPLLILSLYGLILAYKERKL